VSAGFEKDKEIKKLELELVTIEAKKLSSRVDKASQAAMPAIKQRSDSNSQRNSGTIPTPRSQRFGAGESRRVGGGGIVRKPTNVSNSNNRRESVRGDRQSNLSIDNRGLKVDTTNSGSRD